MDATNRLQWRGRTETWEVEDVYLFYKSRHWGSQWHPSKLSCDGIVYSCCEQWMMAEKARMFGDQDALDLILGTTAPSKQKSLGRSVKNFDPSVWDERCLGVVARGNMLKFEQNCSLGDKLLATGDRILAEASSSDRIWGIGLAEDNPDARSVSRWRGTNLLGEALMIVRRDLMLHRIKG